MVARRKFAPAAALAAQLVVACAPIPNHPIPVAILVGGDRAAIGPLAPDAVPGLALREVAIAPPEPPKPLAAIADVARARSAYANGDFDTCRTALAGVDIADVLAAGDRTLAARALTYATACALRAPDAAAAAALADRFASLGLDIPDSAVTPDVETLLADAIARAGAKPRTHLAVAGEIGARLAVDGRAAGCALPCTIDVAAGEHVIAAELDGFSPIAHAVRTPDVATARLAQQPAPAALAAQQWHARIAHAFPADDATGAMLIGRFAGDARIAYLAAEPSAATTLAGTIVVDGALRGTAHGDRGRGADLVRELAYTGGILERPKLWQHPTFWIAVTAATLVIAGVAIWTIYQPPVDTGLKF
jgi:hypothetical protein